jgi:ABC-type multidrug transport system ATPase subunit
MTILLTTHYLEEADRLASRLVIADRGRIVAEGSPPSRSPWAPASRAASGESRC